MKIRGLPCVFTCARKFPRVHGTKNDPIKFYRLLTPSVASALPENANRKCGDECTLSFLGSLNGNKTESLFGLKTYCDTCGKNNEDITLPPTHEEFDDWHLLIPFASATVKVLRCPEDVQCVRLGDAPQCHSSKVCCEQCRAPICRECADCIFARKPSVPPAGLSNDMMIYYAPSILYTENVTLMEMICASVCITSMITFTLEKKYRGSRALDLHHNTNTHRMAARGNATSFPLPWEDLLKQLQDGEKLAQLGQQVSLPRTGKDLGNIVSIILKTSAGDDTEKDVAKLIHQCTVRRHVVVKLIETMKQRGHRAYTHVDMEAVKKNAQALPKTDIPPEIIRYLPLDELQDKIQMQKKVLRLYQLHAMLRKLETI